MSTFLSQLTTRERARLLEELNYMNLEEIRGFCSARAIPYRIVAESSNGKVKATKDTDRKPIVLARVRRYLRTGQVDQGTRISVQIVREKNPPARLGPRDRRESLPFARPTADCFGDGARDSNTTTRTDLVAAQGTALRGSRV